MKTTYVGEAREPIPYDKVERRMYGLKFKHYAEVLTRLGYDAVYENPAGARARIRVEALGVTFVFFSRRQVFDFLMVDYEPQNGGM